MTISAGIAVGVALGVVCGLALLLRTGWLQSNTLQKCVVLSLLLHLVVVGGWTLFGARDGGAAGAAADSESVTVVLVVEDEVAEAAEPAAREPSAELAAELSSASIMPPDSAEAGPYADVVDRGMWFLAERQRADGSLAGPAAFFAELYCHGMATLAVAECYALTGDPALRPVLRRAIGYTVSRQHPTTGGWRYAAGDRGDTSQLGWQLMALASSRQLGLAEAAAAEEASRGFLDTVTSGRRAGLASYRPGERPTPAMTAEALYARLLLGLSPESPTVAEAAAFLDQHRPGRSRVDSYAWYYGTLALFHVGGEPWQRWNSGLQQTLLSLQRTGTGSPVGSWDPDAAWGRHGGRVYATAVAALMLEVYYRYQPLHGQGREKRAE